MPSLRAFQAAACLAFVAWLGLVAAAGALMCHPYALGGCPAYTVLLGAHEVSRSVDLTRDVTVVLYSSTQTSDASQCGVVNQNCAFASPPPPLPPNTTATVLSRLLARESCALGADLKTAYGWWVAFVAMLVVPSAIAVTFAAATKCRS